MAEVATPFFCEGCGRWHDKLPLSFSVKVPLAATEIPPAELEMRLVLTRDQCVIDGTAFYLRGRVVVPVIGLEEPFIWGVWAEVSPKNFVRTHELWNQPGREREPQYPGWLDTDLPIYDMTHDTTHGTTVNLEVGVQTQVVGRRPHFAIVSARHPLAVEQREGITLERVKQIAAFQCTEAALSQKS